MSLIARTAGIGHVAEEFQWDLDYLLRIWQARRTRSPMPADLRFLWLWLGLPLAIFCLARSRLPLYLLPLF